VSDDGRKVIELRLPAEDIADAGRVGNQQRGSPARLGDSVTANGWPCTRSTMASTTRTQ
jgi:hypothetical protein